MLRREFIKGSAIFGASIANPALARARSGLFESKHERKIARILNADRTKVGTLPIMRAFAGNHRDLVSPYVLFDEFGPVDINAGTAPLRVDAHPHAGFTPTTYFLEGSGHHKDSLNYDFQIDKGQFMMFNSGRGAIHMEESGRSLYEQGGRYHGFQIWLNMPSKYKHIDPSTDVFGGTDLGKEETDQYILRSVLGEAHTAKSSIALRSPAFYYHVTLKPDGKLELPVEATHNAFIYMIKGQMEIEGRKKLKANQLALYERGGELIRMYSDCGADLLVLGGQPLNEPIYSYGPFVMNSEEQIRQCIADYQSGKMGDPDLVN